MQQQQSENNGATDGKSIGMSRATMDTDVRGREWTACNAAYLLSNSWTAVVPLVAPRLLHGKISLSVFVQIKPIRQRVRATGKGVK